MSLQPPFTDWKDPPLPARDPAPLRLVALDGGAVIYQASTTKAAHSAQGFRFLAKLTPIAPNKLSGGLPPEIDVAQAFAMVPDFDLVALDGGAFAFAIEFFKGGSRALQRGEAANGKVAIGATYHDSTDYRRPRFVRGHAAPARMLTAVVNRSAVAMMDEQPLQTGGGIRRPAPYTVLAAGDSGVAIATPPPNGKPSSVALFAKAAANGNTLPNGDRPGTLSLTRLAQGHPSGKPELLFDRDGTYSFDADVQGDVALVLGSTTQGPQLVTCDLGSGAIGKIAWPQGYPASGTWIASPSVLALAGGKAFALAFFEHAGNGATGIRYAQLDLASLG
jgi:hypothetical protein